jgi:hypothetical protein
MNKEEFAALVEQRNDLDFAAFCLLREMQSDGLLTADAILHGLRRDPDVTKQEAEDTAVYYVNAVDDLVKKRRALDTAIVMSVVGGTA